MAVRSKINKYALSRKLRAHARQLMMFAMRIEQQPVPSDNRIFSNLRNHKKRINETLDEELNKWNH